MKYFSGCAILLAVFYCAFALNDEAETVPTDSDSPPRDDGEGRVIVVVRPTSFNPFYSDVDPFTRIFNRMFRDSFPFSSYPNRPNTDVFGSTVPEDGDSDLDVRGGFPNFSFDFPSFNGPDFDSLPDNYDNTTHEVKVVNGTRIEVNSTVTKNKDDNGVFVQEVTIVRYSPEKPINSVDVPNNGRDVPSEVDTTNMNRDSPANNRTNVDKNANPSDNEVTNTETGAEDFGIKPVILKRKRRWIMPEFFQNYFGNIFKRKKSESISTTIKPTFGSHLGDTKVNYINNNDLNIEADAIVFDPKRLEIERKKSLSEKLQMHSDHSKNSPKQNLLTKHLKEREYNPNSLNRYNIYNNRHYKDLTHKPMRLPRNSRNLRNSRNSRFRKNSKLSSYSRQRNL